MGNLVINPVWDSSVLNLGTTVPNGTDPLIANTTANYQAAANAAINYFTSTYATIGNNVTLTIDFAWGATPASATATYDASGNITQAGTASAVTSGGASFTNQVAQFTYPQFRSIIAAAFSAPGANAVQQTALANVFPVTAPASGNIAYALNSAQLAVLGNPAIGNNPTILAPMGNLPVVNGAQINGYSTLGNTGTWAWNPSVFTTNPTATFNAADAVAVDEHEISEILGRVGSAGANSFTVGGTQYVQYTMMDFFEYTATGTPPAAGTNAPAGGFPGLTNLVQNIPNTNVAITAPAITAKNPIYFSPNGTQAYLPFRLPTDNASADIVDWGSTAPATDPFVGVSSGGAAGIVSVSDQLVTQVLGLTLACFATGTRIATARGEVAVEDLVEGDLAVTASGRTAPIQWIGHRWVDCTRHPKPRDVLPVRVLAGAFGPHQPRCDLLLSPDHAVYIEDVLIPIRHLINGATIRQEHADTITYWHVELPEHDLILAEGLRVESYLETGGRSAFANGGGVVQQHPDFGRVLWEAESCAKLVAVGRELEAARNSLLSRAHALGFRLTQDADPIVIAQGQEIRGIEVNGMLRFDLPDGTATVRLVSRHAAAAELSPNNADHRRLGVAVSAMAIDSLPVSLNHIRLGDGWHDVQDGVRWTNGSAMIAIGRRKQLDIQIAGTARYWVEPPLSRAA